MADSTATLDLIVQSQASKEVTANAFFDASSSAVLYGRRETTTTGLVFGGYGGRYNSAVIANWTLTLTASTTNYIVALRTTGAVSFSTSITNWNNTIAYIRLYLVVTGTATITSYEDHRQAIRGTIVQAIPIAISDETTSITAGTAKVTFRMPYAMTGVTVRASLTTAQASGSIFTVDVNEGGSSILSTKLTIDNTEKTSTTAATPAVVSDSSLADDAEITIDIDQVGDGTATGLKVSIIGVPVQ